MGAEAGSQSAGKESFYFRVEAEAKKYTASCFQWFFEGTIVDKIETK